MKATDLYAICPTNRPWPAQQLTLNLIQTSQCHIILVANPKVEIFNQLDTFKRTLPKAAQSRLTLYYSPYVVGSAPAANYGWGKLRGEIGNKRNILAMFCTDDCAFREGWYKPALESYKEAFPERDGLMFLRDHTAPNNKPRTGIAIVSAKFCDLYLAGWFVPPWYMVSGIDIEYKEVAEKHGKCADCPDAHVMHLLYNWSKTRDSEQRKLALLILRDRANRGWPYDIEAPWKYFMKAWRYWK